MNQTHDEGLPPPNLALDTPLVGTSLATTWQRLRAFWQMSFDGHVAKVAIFSAALLSLTHRHVTVSGFERHFKASITAYDSHPLRQMFGHLYWFWLGGPILLFAVPLLFGRYALRMKPAELGCSVGNWRSGLKWTFGLYAAFLPCIVIASFMGPFQKMYPMNKLVGTQAVAYFVDGSGSLWPYILYTLSYGVYFIGWEFFFRGFLGFSLFKRFGYHAVLVAMIPFAVLHVGKPDLEMLGSIPAGILLGVFALRERSFLYGALLHMLVAWTMDVLAIWHKVQAATST
jgi:uncharacterized protein